MAEVVINRAALNALVRRVDGPVSRKLIRDGLIMAAEGRARVPKDSGALANSIGAVLLPSERGGIKIRVGSELPYAASVHNGARPHWAPYGPGSRMAGWADRHGQSAFGVASRVAQRGTHATPYLTPQLRRLYPGSSRIYSNVRG